MCALSPLCPHFPPGGGGLYSLALNIHTDAAPTDLPAMQNARVELLTLFFRRCNFQIPLENQPIGPTLLLLIKARQRKSCEFIPLINVTNAIDGRDLEIDNTRVKLNAELTLDIGATSKKRNSDFNHIAETFARAVRALVISYALVSSADPIESAWRNYNAEQQRIATAEAFSRARSKSNYRPHSRAMDAELLVRSDWTRAPHAEPDLTLAQIIATVEQRHTLWPTLQEFRTMGKGGKPSPGDWKAAGKGNPPNKPWPLSCALFFRNSHIGPEKNAPNNPGNGSSKTKANASLTDRSVKTTGPVDSKCCDAANPRASFLASSVFTFSTPLFALSNILRYNRAQSMCAGGPTFLCSVAFVPPWGVDAAGQTMNKSYRASLRLNPRPNQQLRALCVVFYPARRPTQPRQA